MPLSWHKSVVMKFMKNHLARLLGGALLLALALAPSSSRAETKKVLVVTLTYGFHHSSIPTAEKVLTELAAKSGAFTVDIIHGDQKPDKPDEAAKWDAAAKKALAEKMSPEGLKQYNAVIFANTTGDLPLPDRDAFIAWIHAGGALIGMHSASDTFHGFRPYLETLGGEFLTHNAQATVECLVQDPEHPAVSHFGPSFTVTDEIYIQKNFHRDQVHGLLGLDQHPNSKAPGDYPISWCKQVGAGRVFYTELGHREDVWENPAYQQHILGGIKWALGLEAGSAVPQNPAVKLSEDETKDGFRPLFNGVDLAGWKPRHADGPSTWSAQNGMLVNELAPGHHGVDLVGEEKFWNFTVRYEYMVPKNSNSGFYLRGRHEIQILDDYDSGQATPGGNGAIYNLAAPSKFVSRQPGAWQQAEVTLIDHHVTVTLNGEKVQDNVLVDRATGSELDENVNEPGPFFLQGDHGAVAFRNLRVKVLK